MTVSKLRKMLIENGSFHQVSASIKKGTVTVRQGFFYRLGRTAEDLKSDVMTVVDIMCGSSVELVDHGECWKAFNGGAPLQRQSHWYVVLKIREDDDV